MQFINVAPHPSSHAPMRQLFRESIAQHQATIDKAEQLRAFTQGLDSEFAEIADEAIELFVANRQASIDSLQDGIAELDRVDAINAAIREAGY